jgi:hypothetical protein
MLSLHSMARYALAATALSCLGVGSWYVSTSGHLTDTPILGQEETSHRGSGRLITQESSLTREFTDAIAYRGTGRVHDQSECNVVAHRGSGRIDEQSPTPNPSAYRGSGRVVPSPFQEIEYV